MKTKLLSLLLISLVAIVPFRMNAQVLCNAPSGLVTTNITTTGASLSWIADSNAYAYVVQYKSNLNPSAAWITVTTQNNTITLSNLTCGTQYVWHVAAHCSNTTGAISPYSASITFTTLSCTTTCLPPTGLSTTNITKTGATFSWTAITGVTAYVVKYKQIANPNAIWINITAQTNTISLSNLTCGTQYEWHVASQCSNNNGTATLSPYSAGFTFSTDSCTVSPCNPPLGLVNTNITTTGATLSWTPVVGAVGYLVQYKPMSSSSTTWLSITTQTNSVTLTNLACGTLYQWHVAAQCIPGAVILSPYSPSINFTTLPCTTTCVPPTGLVTTNVTKTGATLSWSAVTGIMAYKVQYKSVSTPSAPWVSITAQTNSVVLSNLTCGTLFEWHVASICSNTAGSISPYSPGVTFGTDSCTSVPCYPPTGLVNTNITATGATLTWTPVIGAAGYLVQYKPLSSAGTAWINITSQTNSITLSNLTYGTQYQWHVATHCGISTNNLSPYSSVMNFVTDSCSFICDPPTGLLTSNITQTGATLSWSPTPIGVYIVQYRPATSSSGTWISITTQNTSVILTNLPCGTPYQWRVSVACPLASPLSAPFSPIFNFTTLPCTNTCIPPTGLITTNITKNGATLKWVPVPGVTSYKLQYRVIANAIWQWTTVTVQGNLYTLNNLYCGAPYEWRVASLCLATGTISISNYSPTVNFTTLTCTTNGCAAPTGLATNNAAANPASITLLWNATGAISYNIRYKKANTTAWTTLNSTTTTQLLFNLQPGQYQWQVQSVCSSSNGVITLSPWSVIAYFYLPVKNVIFPNPATSDNIYLPITTEVETNVTIIVSDKFGKTLKKIEKTIAPGMDAVNIDVSDLRNGIYFIQTTGDNINELQKIMIAK